MAGETELLRRIATQVGVHGLGLAKEYIRLAQGSKTLQDSMNFLIKVTTPRVAKGEIGVPYYWAEYVHDGRPGFSAPEGAVLVFFPEFPLRDDPRLRGGYPKTRAQAEGRRLDADTFFGFLEQNRIRKQNNQPPIMVAVKTVGPVTKKIPYFTVGLNPLPATADLIAEREFQNFLVANGYFKTEKKVARGTLG